MSANRLFTAQEAVHFLDFLLSLDRFKKRIRRMTRSATQRSKGGQ